MATMTATTDENLKVAFAGESQANQKYRAFARRPSRTGCPTSRGCSAPRGSRAHPCRGPPQALEAIAPTTANLQTASTGDIRVHRNVSSMLEQAEMEAHKAKRMFGYAVQAEEVHARIYQMALDAARQGKDCAAEIYLCRCAVHRAGQADGGLPICGRRRQVRVV